MVRIPTKRPSSVVTIRVVWADGTPVPKASLIITDVTQSASTNGFGVQTDAQGEHTIDGYIGQKLIIDARSERPSELVNGRWQVLERSERVRLTVERPAETIRVVITKLPSGN